MPLQVIEGRRRGARTCQCLVFAVVSPPLKFETDFRVGAFIRRLASRWSARLVPDKQVFFVLWGRPMGGLSTSSCTLGAKLCGWRATGAIPMTRSVFGIIGLTLFVPFADSEAAAADDALTNADIVRLTNAGVGDSSIIAMIGSSTTAFDTGVDDVVELVVAGVGETVITAMVKAGAAGGAPPSGGARDDPAPGVAVASGTVFRDPLSSGDEGPAMVVIPAGRFNMGCLRDGGACFDDEKPAREVTIPVPFALSVHEVTFADYDRFTYPDKVYDEGWGRGRRPVVNVSWNDAREYVEWLSAQTGERYRLPSEAEWEYAARAGTSTKWYHGDDPAGLCREANHADRNMDLAWRNVTCSDGFGSRTAPVGSFAPNAFGLYDMHGNVAEWVADCRNASYAGAPTDGSAWLAGDCSLRVVRSGSWYDGPRHQRAGNRAWSAADSRGDPVGFRVARSITP